MDSLQLCNAMRCCMKSQSKTLQRGSKRKVFIEDDGGYSCIGAQPGRSQSGVQSGFCKLQKGFTDANWDIILKALKAGEEAFYQFATTNVIQHIKEARKIVNYKTMEPSPMNADNKKPATIYNGIGFGVNVFLRCHTDNDFTQSIVQVILDNHDYIEDDRIVCYFCFPRKGIAVALRPGDYILFNSTEPHAISSRCRSSDIIYSLSCYLKTSVVSLHDNTIPFKE